MHIHPNFGVEAAEVASTAGLVVEWSRHRFQEFLRWFRKRCASELGGVVFKPRRQAGEGPKRKRGTGINCPPRKRGRHGQQPWAHSTRVESVYHGPLGKEIRGICPQNDKSQKSTEQRDEVTVRSQPDLLWLTRVYACRHQRQSRERVEGPSEWSG